MSYLKNLFKANFKRDFIDVDIYFPLKVMQNESSVESSFEIIVEMALFIFKPSKTVTTSKPSNHLKPSSFLKRQQNSFNEIESNKETKFY